MTTPVLTGDARVQESVARARRGFAPPPKLRISEFSEQEIIVTTGPLAGTHWRNDFAPYQVGILDVFHEDGVEIAVIMGSSQWGKTSIAGQHRRVPHRARPVHDSDRRADRRSDGEGFLDEPARADHQREPDPARRGQ
jgi:hypothetical protein